MFDGNQSWVDGMILKVSDIPSESNKQVSVKNNPATPLSVQRWNAVNAR